MWEGKSVERVWSSGESALCFRVILYLLEVRTTW
jgi:hypothetical protein